MRTLLIWVCVMYGEQSLRGLSPVIMMQDTQDGPIVRKLEDSSYNYGSILCTVGGAWMGHPLSFDTMYTRLIDP